MDNILLPSILSADFYRLGEQIDTLRDSGCTHLHIDVMDGVFVNNYAIGIPVIKSIDKNSDLFLDCHLMTVDPGRYIDAFADSGADLITIHLEADKTPFEDLEKIKSRGIMSGISVKPGTDIEEVFPFIDKGMVDLVLIMSVEPGFGGQGFITSSLDKIKVLKRYIDECPYEINIEIDGGINEDNIETVNTLGVNMIVAGSAVFRGDIRDNFIRLNSIIQKQA